MFNLFIGMIAGAFILIVLLYLVWKRFVKRTRKQVEQIMRNPKMQQDLNDMFARAAAEDIWELGTTTYYKVVDPSSIINVLNENIEKLRGVRESAELEEQLKQELPEDHPKRK